MPNAVELAAHLVMLGLVVAGVRHLRKVQPDPNPAIEARLAAEEAARLAAAGDGVTGAPSPAIVEVTDWRTQELPYVGIDRRAARKPRAPQTVEFLYTGASADSANH